MTSLRAGHKTLLLKVKVDTILATEGRRGLIGDICRAKGTSTASFRNSH